MAYVSRSQLNSNINTTLASGQNLPASVLRNAIAAIIDYSDSGAGIGIYRPESFNLNSSDAGPAIQAAIDAMPAEGGVLLLTQPIYYVETPININKPVKMYGNGTFLTRIKTHSTTAELITVSAVGVSLEDFLVVNLAATPTAGCGIKFIAPSAYCSIDKVYVTGFYDNIKIESSPFTQISKLLCWDFVRYGLSLKNTVDADTGDISITMSDFTAYTRASESAIYQESSGGLKLSSVKFNWAAVTRFKKALELNIQGSTSDLMINNCSFENYTESAIKIRVASGQVFRQIAIAGNQFASYASAPYHIDIKDAEAVAIAGNTFSYGVNGIKLQNVTSHTSNMDTNNAFYTNTGTAVTIS